MARRTPTPDTPPEATARGHIPSVLHRNCGSQQVLELVADRWTALLIYSLARGPRRPGELQREIGGISQKMLTQTLRKLERDGLVARTVHPVVPPRVDYTLTPLGETLIAPLSALCRWAEAHLGEVLAARERNDPARSDGAATS